VSDTTRAEDLFKERENRDSTIKAQEEARVQAMRDQIQRLRALRLARDKYSKRPSCPMQKVSQNLGERTVTERKGNPHPWQR
jgi:hypothetical protein